MVKGNGRIGFIFPGQGAQKVGMGSDLLASDPQPLERYLSEAEALSGLPIRKYCLEGPIEDLTRTEVAQPALFALSLSLAELAREMGLLPGAVAGHSLGEYTAAVVSGALGSDDGMRLVCKRGRLMGEIQSSRPGAMAAVIGLSVERVQELCAQASAAGTVAPANLNSPTQVVVSGEEAAVEALVTLATEAGAVKALRLQVGAAFHSELMKPVQAQLGEVMKTIRWNDPEVPLAANFSGEMLSTADAIQGALITQIASPVRWMDCVESLVEAGCTTLLELGPGRVLGGLVRQINADVETVSADSREKLESFAERVRV